MCSADQSSWLNSLMTPLIATIAVYIAYQQLKTNERSLNHELYDRRLKIYEIVKEMIRELSNNDYCTYVDLNSYYKAVSEADFLFGDEITIYIEEIYKHGINLIKLKKQYKEKGDSAPAGYDHEKICNEILIEEQWITSQPEHAKKKFKDHIKIYSPTILTKIKNRLFTR